MFEEDDRMKEEIGRMIKGMEDTLTKMPKDIMQKMRWCEEFERETYEKLAKSGLDLYTVLGVLERIKARFHNGGNFREVSMSIMRMEGGQENEKDRTGKGKQGVGAGSKRAKTSKSTVKKRK